MTHAHQPGLQRVSLQYGLTPWAPYFRRWLEQPGKVSGTVAGCDEHRGDGGPGLAGIFPGTGRTMTATSSVTSPGSSAGRSSMPTIGRVPIRLPEQSHATRRRQRIFAMGSQVHPPAGRIVGAYAATSGRPTTPGRAALGKCPVVNSDEYSPRTDGGILSQCGVRAGLVIVIVIGH